jgi:hypothetical protein
MRIQVCGFKAVVKETRRKWERRMAIFGTRKAALADDRSGLRFDAFNYSPVVPGAANCSACP